MAVTRPAAAGALLLLLAGCGGSDEPEGPPAVQVAVGSQDVRVAPSQYCLDGDWQRYSTTPPIIEVPPDSTISLTVPKPVAERGWSVQVFDDTLENTIGEVAVPSGTTTFDEINSSDAVPPTYYLVVVENKGGDCGELSGAWPVGFIRSGS